MHLKALKIVRLRIQEELSENVDVRQVLRSDFDEPRVELTSNTLSRRSFKAKRKVIRSQVLAEVCIGRVEGGMLV